MSDFEVIIVTGLSGSGKSTALNTLEDIGYEAVDNIPLALLNSLIEGANQFNRPLVIGIDIRSHSFSAKRFIEAIENVKKQHTANMHILFLDAEDEIIRRRYTETRRKHPLAKDRPVIDGILHERELIEPIRHYADHVMDTSEWKVADFKQRLLEQFAKDKDILSIFLLSFSFKAGLPREADIVIDVRFLQNPYYEETLRELDGRNPLVAEYIEKDERFSGFMQHLKTMLTPLLPYYSHEGKSYLTIAIGCTGGKHRSVCVSEALYRYLSDNKFNVHLKHRELESA
jgi:UPF0042 nucleotide-binding protein